MDDQQEMLLVGGGSAVVPYVHQPDVASRESDGILPVWEDDTGLWMLLPNCLVRTGLFGISNNGKMLKRTKIPSLAGIEMVYTGGQLVQSDFDVWYGALSLSKAQGNASMIVFGANQFLKMLDRSTGKSDREWLKMSMAKLKATAIEVTLGDHTYVGSLLDDFYRDEKSEKYVVKLNLKMASMFAPNTWSTLDFKQRSELRRKPLAQWLHAFYSTHRQPLDYGVEKIMTLCVSECANLADFRKKLRRALEALAEVTGWTCRINKEADTLTVIKGGSDRVADKSAFSEQFTAFWEAYHPRKRINFARSAQIWKDSNLDGEANEIMAGLERWNKSADWHADDGKWIPAPDRWLENKRWLDEPSVKKASLVKSGTGTTHDHGTVARDYGEMGSF